jgi:hypothetical protein
MDQETLHETINRLKPDTVAMTFINYEFPELYGASSLPRAEGLIGMSTAQYPASYFRFALRGIGGSRSTIVNTGPLPEHIFEL